MTGQDRVCENRFVYFSTPCLVACIHLWVQPWSPIDPGMFIQVQNVASWTGLWLRLESCCLPLSGSFDWANRANACWCELADGELCVVLSALIPYGLAWFWFVPACCDHISNAYRPYWGNGQRDLTQQLIVLVIIFRKHAHTRVHSLLSVFHSVLYKLTHK